MQNRYRPVVLLILDGFGIAPHNEGNAITQARLPFFSSYSKDYPVMTLAAAGNEVGLSFGEMGNSEVGHLNIGAGRIYYQSLPRINHEISVGNFFKNQVFLEAVEHVKKNKSKLHLIGMVSSGNIHSSNQHLYAFLKLCKEYNISKQVFIHGILDGRDTPYNSGEKFFIELDEHIKKIKVGKIASLSGRYYAMDRDNHWDRIEKAYRVMVEGKAERSSAFVIKAIKNSYEKNNYDEEFIPTLITENGSPVGRIASDDAVIFFNFRPDRARQLTEALVLPGFNKFKRRPLKNLFFVTLTEYEKNFPVLAAYPPIIVNNSLAEVISKHGLSQLHVAETEKYAHITYFFNGMIEASFAKEERVLIPSPRVGNYALTPRMSIDKIGKVITEAIEKKKYDFIVANFANADMVGHTGDKDATIKACEAVDQVLHVVVEHTLARKGVVLVTADHGNAEEVINLQTGGIDKEHSTNPVPLLIIGKDFLGQAGPGGDPLDGDLSLLPPVGMLGDVAPTILKLLGIPQPEEMIGRALI